MQVARGSTRVSVQLMGRARTLKWQAMRSMVADWYSTSLAPSAHCSTPPLLLMSSATSKLHPPRLHCQPPVCCLHV